MSDQNPTADHPSFDGEPSGSPMEANLKSRATWTRFLFMLISGVLVSIASFVGSFVVVLGFFWVLFTGEVNRQVQQAGQSIAAYIYESIRYLTFNTDQKPFPLGGAWPNGTVDD